MFFSKDTFNIYAPVNSYRSNFYWLGFKYIPPFVALPSKTTRKSDWALTVTCPGYQSGLAVFKVVADICQTYSRNKISVSNYRGI